MPKPRKKNTKQMKRKFFILCEGRKTEPNYLRGFIRSIGLKGYQAKVVDTKKNTPRELVKEAKRLRRDESVVDTDIFWVVFDRNGHANIDKAFNEAEHADIKIAFSAACFEYWILLHFEMTTAGKACCDDVISMIKRNYIPSYTKGEKRAFKALEHLVSTARMNAKIARNIVISGAPPSAHIYELNPYTDVDILLSALEEFAKDKT